LLRWFQFLQVCANETLSADLLAVTYTVSALKRRHYPEFCDEWVGVEISTSDGFSTLMLSTAVICCGEHLTNSTSFHITYPEYDVHP
jgi:hypothetical protein